MEREIEQKLSELREENSSYIEKVRRYLRIITIFWLVFVSVYVYSHFGSDKKATAFYTLNGGTVAEMVTDFERQSGKTLSAWFKGRIEERCNGKDRLEWELIINQIGASAPKN